MPQVETNIRSTTHLHHEYMKNSTKLGLGALVTATVLLMFYQTQARRKRFLDPRTPRRPSNTEFLPLAKVVKEVNHQLTAGQQVTKDLPKVTAEEGQHANLVTETTDNERQKNALTDHQWLKFTDKLLIAKESILSIEWGKITDFSSVFPDWAIGLPEWTTKLQKELNMEPGSLADEIWREAKDPKINPEVEWDAHVRQGTELCDEEKVFLGRRKKFTKKALAKYLEIPESDIHDDDVPVIAITGSGGGLRAMVAGTGFYQALATAGLYDCATYTAGVSGSCWLQSLYLTSIGGCSFSRVIQHLKTRICVHIAYPPKALELVTSTPTNKYLLRGVVERLRTGYSSFGLVDLYGLLLGARLLVPSDELNMNDGDLKLSNQKKYIENGEQPLPIYTAVRHEIPFVGGENEKGEAIPEEIKEQASKTGDSWFQWFEATPYELFCEDLEGKTLPVTPHSFKYLGVIIINPICTLAGIPTWAIGRRFKNGINIDREVPEMKLPLLFGIFGSAFCATLSHYYAEIRPFVTSIALFLTLDKMVLDRNEDLSKVHPIDPAMMPNFVKGLKESLPPTCPACPLGPQHKEHKLIGNRNHCGSQKT